LKRRNYYKESNSWQLVAVVTSITSEFSMSTENPYQENPYQSPQADLWRDPTYGEVPERSVMWILFSFEGRIPRRVYWGATLATTLIFYGCVFGLAFLLGEESDTVTILMLLFDIPVIWISLALQIKRWHDRDKSGFWVFINFVPLIGTIWSFIEVGCLRGTEGPNQYGSDPT
jgi:uncharacterized membrane protein YhaH (DUF805 family)